ncbi:putative chaperone protein HSP31 [Rhizodiscina lignyota]|uniref:D-lactate dehydratase n=1 Tax=Rhizodiscina lignyota TaxID=1504668 RepID=A0A9P4I8Z9_9PEZI|nr:putative chaperone protein HSP31 [Rhizodiscina lignyota]
MSPKVLFVLTSHDKIDAIDKPTGWYLPEFAHPYGKLAPHAEIVVASPAGGAAPLDPGSVDYAKNDEESQKFLQEKRSLWEKTEKLESFKGRAAEFDAIFFVGGHGPMYDLAVSPVSQDIIREFYESSKVVAAVCHGPAALLNVKLSNGTLLIAGQKVTAFSNAEEEAVGLLSAMPFPLETALKKNMGGDNLFEVAAEQWAPKVVVSGKNGKLITGQNPASAGPIGEAVLEAISA